MCRAPKQDGVYVHVGGCNFLRGEGSESVALTRLGIEPVVAEGVSASVGIVDGL